MNQGPGDRDAIDAMAQDRDMAERAHAFFLKSAEHRYGYNFTWLGRPIIQYPQDVMAMQEIVWEVKPELVIETGIAHGGSLILYASLLELIGGSGRVLGIDIELRSHNRAAILAHPLARRIDLLPGSSTDAAVAANAARQASGKRVLVVLDSNHTHDHVSRELDLYSPLVERGSYVVVFDTGIERMPASAFPDRPWGPGDNPATAVKAFLAKNDRFVVDEMIDKKLLVSAAPGGYLRCVKN